MKYLYYICLFVLASCSKVQMDDCITSAGPEHSIVRQLPAFDQIVVGDKLRVNLVQDSVAFVRLTGPKNLLGQIASQVEDGVLELDNNNSCNFVRSFDVRFDLEVHFTALSRIEIQSAAEVRSKDSLVLDNLDILHAALSDLDLLLKVKETVFVQSFNSAFTRLGGTAKSLKGSIEEVSDLDARDLVCQEVILDHHSPLDCFIDGRSIIFVKIYNKGNIYYRQEPSEYKDLNFRRGSGDLLLLP